MPGPKPKYNALRLLATRINLLQLTATQAGDNPIHFCRDLLELYCMAAKLQPLKSKSLWRTLAIHLWSQRYRANCNYIGSDGKMSITIVYMSPSSKCGSHQVWNQCRSHGWSFIFSPRSFWLLFIIYIEASQKNIILPGDTSRLNQ